MLGESTSCITLMVPPELTQADLLAGGVENWARRHAARGITVSPKRLANLPDSKIIQLTKTYIRHEFTNYGELIAGRTPHEKKDIQRQVNGLITQCFPWLDPSIARRQAALQRWIEAAQALLLEGHTPQELIESVREIEEEFRKEKGEEKQ